LAALKHTFENRGSYLLVVPGESYDLANFRAGIREALAFCREQGLSKILADIRTLGGNIPVLDRFELGVEMAEVLGAFQVAILAPAAMIDRMGENAAVNRGGKVFVTESLERALEWLQVPANENDSD
jgi:hypothetical protein